MIFSSKLVVAITYCFKGLLLKNTFSVSIFPFRKKYEFELLVTKVLRRKDKNLPPVFLKIISTTFMHLILIHFNYTNFRNDALSFLTRDEINWCPDLK